MKAVKDESHTAPTEMLCVTAAEDDVGVEVEERAVDAVVVI